MREVAVAQTQAGHVLAFSLPEENGAVATIGPCSRRALHVHLPRRRPQKGVMSPGAFVHEDADTKSVAGKTTADIIFKPFNRRR